MNHHKRDNFHNYDFDIAKTKLQNSQNFLSNVSLKSNHWIIHKIIVCCVRLSSQIKMTIIFPVTHNTINWNGEKNPKKFLKAPLIWLHSSLNI